MKRMKSRIVRVKVWYEHAPGLDTEMQRAGVERELWKAIARGHRGDQSSDVALDSFEVGDGAAPSERPEPDF